MAFPLIVRAIRLALEAVDPRLEEAAGTLGASPIKVFAFVTLPLILPGLVTGAVVGFAKALGEFGATITFVSNIPGETQTLGLGNLRCVASAGSRGGGGADDDCPVADFVLWGAVAVGSIGQKNGTPMSLDLDIHVKRGRFTLEVQGHSSGGG